MTEFDLLWVCWKELSMLIELERKWNWWNLSVDCFLIECFLSTRLVHHKPLIDNTLLLMCKLDNFQ